MLRDAGDFNPRHGVFRHHPDTESHPLVVLNSVSAVCRQRRLRTQHWLTDSSAQTPEKSKLVKMGTFHLGWVGVDFPTVVFGFRSSNVNLVAALFDVLHGRNLQDVVDDREELDAVAEELLTDALACRNRVIVLPHILLS